MTSSNEVQGAPEAEVAYAQHGDTRYFFVRGDARFEVDNNGTVTAVALRSGTVLTVEQVSSYPVRTCHDCGAGPLDEHHFACPALTALAEVA